MIGPSQVANAEFFLTEAEQAVLDGKAHAYVGGLVETTFLELQHPDKVDTPLSKPLLVSVAGMGRGAAAALELAAADPANAAAYRANASDGAAELAGPDDKLRLYADYRYREDDGVRSEDGERDERGEA